MKEVYGDCCLNRSNVCVAQTFFGWKRCGREDQRSGRPISSRTPEIIEKVRNFEPNYHCAPLRMMADSLNINKETQFEPSCMKIWTK
ncbi:hypothetical protein TNCV_1225401 [Trichonephila clavipes]|nr:hypothetical protein TNCV_1225401 [Trichonephila clavipes]